MATVIFDFDGTMVDSLEIVAQIIYTMSKQKYKFTREDILALHSRSLKAVAKEFKIPRWKIVLLIIKGRKMMTEYMIELEPYPGLADVIKNLSRTGNDLYIVSTNSTSNIDIFLKNYEMKRLFKKVVGGSGLFDKSKTLRSIIKKQKIPEKPYFYIGDETRDMEAAKQAGINGIAVTWGFTGVASLAKTQPFAIAKTPAQLLEIINAPVLDN
jgi:phosphoglycolate phosphatase